MVDRWFSLVELFLSNIHWFVVIDLLILAIIGLRWILKSRHDLPIEKDQ